ncbi:hypothetical protein [Streptomyces albipurpureus]|uniref:Uncharacterized protein n=1 Tax=Streptomyces albipurpureus TaxID=2897419 RepID=A0ABT0UVA6_9ACTN|nr:hypothetical protein [Streptomyces sp. CWNU-1]MCM2392045.1 hypothetical protein [Streptomyces sp. CWNU-1]
MKTLVGVPPSAAAWGAGAAAVVRAGAEVAVVGEGLLVEQPVRVKGASVVMPTTPGGSAR